MTGFTSAGTGRTSGLILEYPMSLGVFEKYEDAQQAVDFLSDREFPVENCMIVGTDLRQVERVTGRLTLGRVAAAGLVTGIWMGLFVGLIFALFSPSGDAFMTILWAMAFGAVFALVWAVLGHALTRGRRDFTSVSQVIATRYEVLTEHKFAERARDLLVELPGGTGPRTFGAPAGRAPAGRAPTPPQGQRQGPGSQAAQPSAPPPQAPAPQAQPASEQPGRTPLAQPGPEQPSSAPRPVTGQDVPETEWDPAAAQDPAEPRRD